jgi:uncharacterized protein
MREIQAALMNVEREFDVRVLLAVESGSRAWGFASPDSDYDVRFIYAHRSDWYLSIHESRDVIERMLPQDLDVSGWDLRKSLRLFAKCNVAMNEWLGSPIQYGGVPAFRAELQALLPKYFNPIAGMHHYRRMATSALEGNLVDGSIGIKKLFYVLRPLLACRWIAHARSQPPTEFARLVDAEWVNGSERAWIAELLERKARAKEKETIALAADRESAFRAEFAGFEAMVATLPAAARDENEDLDAVLRRWILRNPA